MKKNLLLLTFAFLISLPALYSQVVINELMVNGPGGCDGACNPDTEEWVELYNTTGSNVDISCWRMVDGDFVITFPSGTVIAANDFFTLGGAALEATAPDLDWGNCGGCASGTLIGTFTNSGEQVALFDAAGNWIDGIYWSGGQSLPFSGTAPNFAGCTAFPFTLPATSDPNWTNVGGSNPTNGATYARQTNGSATWEERTGTAISFGTSNGGSLPVDYARELSLSYENGKGILSWATINEINNDKFLILRKGLEEQSFSIVGEVAGMGTSAEGQEYHFIDNQPLQGTSFYRLQQIDFDGKSRFSNVAELNVQPYTSNNIRVYPNPAEAQVYFDLPSSQAYSIQLFDMTGKVLRVLENQGEASVVMQVSDIGSGLYFYAVSGEGTRFTGKIIIE